MKVLKFGGTSVASAERISNVAQLISTGSKPVLVVLSAMAGTTNTLVEIARLLLQRKPQEAAAIIENLYEKYQTELQLLFPREGSRRIAQAAVECSFALMREMCERENFSLFEEKRILAQGELMSTAMMLRHLQDMGKKAVIIPALDFMKTDKNAEPDLPYITSHLRPLVQTAPGDTEIYITEGYICLNAYNRVDNLRRGGSDYTASLAGVAIGAEEIQIWTDIDGLHNNDPRFVDKTAPVRRLHFDEASELAYFGAKILHPTCIQPAREHNIPVRLLDTLNPSLPGTFISLDTEKDVIKAVSAKDGIIAIKVKSNHKLVSWHFLRRVFEVFERYAVVVDMVTTSEVGISLTIDNDEKLPEIQRELEELGSISVERGLTIICVVGDMKSDNIGFEARIVEAIRTFPVRMISYGGSDYNMTVLIRESDKREVLVALSEHLFSTTKSS
ncbi:aspartate kinase [Porphyromonas crevioricanis]|uniref:Aspartokinase n=1 Tax=Porphyromonas crevioricanis JCM 15906 TaxID=1305617 RepID=T1CLZ1_9PORP|nr:aspartate kinase [Porphyromonas crevioricanis]KGN89972.1 aspartate kinase [Porphyromonas crevioricanis]GAD04642.1 aspartokinase [Porphyromonas crevioricanis JCM 15906]